VIRFRSTSFCMYFSSGARNSGNDDDMVFSTCFGMPFLLRYERKEEQRGTE
jgi:ATP-dependent phosphoenolpyruvate carboxykinase